MLLVAAVLIILLTSFFCSLSEASLLSLGRERVETLAERSKTGRILKRMKENLDRPIAAILILNTVANTAGAAMAGSEYERLFGGAHLGWFTLFLTVAVLLFSELIPKALGVRRPESAALLVAQPLKLVTNIFRPLTWLVAKMSRLLGGDASRAHRVSIDDLRAMARLAMSAKVLGKEELTIIEAAAQLPRVTVNQIMIHAEDIVFISMDDEPEQILVRARKSQHTRMLLCRHGLQSILGVVNMKEVLWTLAEDDCSPHEMLKRVLGEAMREPFYVDSTLDLGELIRQFALHHEHLAVVRGPKGTVLGIVTLEDIVEELMGEIDDEYDHAPTRIEKIGPQRWRVGGGALVADVQKTLSLPDDIEVQEDLDGREDINDLAAQQLRGRLRSGGTFHLDRWRFRVVRMRRGKVLYVEAEREKARARANSGTSSSDAASTASQS